MSHDQVTRFLSQQDLTSTKLWKVIKKTAREIESEEGLLFDDTIQETPPHSKENDLICRQYDHTVGHSVKGINLLNCLYYANEVSLPIAFKLVKKLIKFCDIKTKKEKRKSTITRNEQLRDMLTVCCKNQLKWRYALADSWFSSSDNMQYIHYTLEKYFILALKCKQIDP